MPCQEQKKVWEQCAIPEVGEEEELCKLSAMQEVGEEEEFWELSATPEGGEEEEFWKLCAMPEIGEEEEFWELSFTSEGKPQGLSVALRVIMLLLSPPFIPDLWQCLVDGAAFSSSANTALLPLCSRANFSFIVFTLLSPLF